MNIYPHNNSSTPFLFLFWISRNMIGESSMPLFTSSEAFRGPRSVHRLLCSDGRTLSKKGEMERVNYMKCRTWLRLHMLFSKIPLTMPLKLMHFRMPITSCTRAIVVSLHDDWIYSVHLALSVITINWNALSVALNAIKMTVICWNGSWILWGTVESQKWHCDI